MLLWQLIEMKCLNWRSAKITETKTGLKIKKLYKNIYKNQKSNNL